MTNRLLNIPLTGLALLAILTLTACGGGGGGGGSSSTSPSGSIDETNDPVLNPLAWDEGNWDNVTWE